MDLKRPVYKLTAKLINKKYNLNSGGLKLFLNLRNGIESYKDNIENLFIGSSNGEFGKYKYV